MKTLLKVVGVLAVGYLAINFIGFLLGKILLVGAIGAAGYMILRARKNKRERQLIGNSNFRSMYARDDEKESVRRY